MSQELVSLPQNSELYTLYLTKYVDFDKSNLRYGQVIYIINNTSQTLDLAHFDRFKWRDEIKEPVIEWNSRSFTILDIDTSSRENFYIAVSNNESHTIHQVLRYMEVPLLKVCVGDYKIRSWSCRHDLITNIIYNNQWVVLVFGDKSVEIFDSPHTIIDIFRLTVLGG
jgi:hypothetical protein